MRLVRLITCMYCRWWWPGAIAGYLDLQCCPSPNIVSPVIYRIILKENLSQMNSSTNPYSLLIQSITPFEYAKSIPLWCMYIYTDPSCAGQKHMQVRTWLSLCSKVDGPISHLDGWVPERCNSISNALELRLSCTNPLIQWCQAMARHCIEYKDILPSHCSLANNDLN